MPAEKTSRSAACDKDFFEMDFQSNWKRAELLRAYGRLSESLWTKFGIDIWKSGYTESLLRDLESKKVDPKTVKLVRKVFEDVAKNIEHCKNKNAPYCSIVVDSGECIGNVPRLVFPWENGYKFSANEEKLRAIIAAHDGVGTSSEIGKVDINDLLCGLPEKKQD